MQILCIKIFTAKHWGPGGRDWVLKGHVHCGPKPFPLIRGGKKSRSKTKREWDIGEDCETHIAS